MIYFVYIYATVTDGRPNGAEIHNDTRMRNLQFTAAAYLLALCPWVDGSSVAAGTKMWILFSPMKATNDRSLLLLGEMNDLRILEVWTTAPHSPPRSPSAEKMSPFEKSSSPLDSGGLVSGVVGRFSEG